MDDTSGWSIDADLAIEPMLALGWRVDTVPWRSASANWSDYDAVYIGTPWDYPDDPELFLQTLARIERAAVLINPLSLVRWNLTKSYLRDLQGSGAAIVPTLWLNEVKEADIDGLFDRCNGDGIIIKPAVSTNATDTFLVSRSELDKGLRELLTKTFENRLCLVQPFIPAVQSEGEFSLFYMGDQFSHAIQKCPKPGDFRVQEEHGASIVAVEPEPGLIAAAAQVMSSVDPAPMYARVDFVRNDQDQFLLMELELIEPSLYLRMHGDAPRRFAEAFDEYVREERK